MKTSTAIKMAGSAKALSGILGVSQAAVAQWKDSDRIPELRIYQLREKRPEWFAKAPTRKKA